MREFQSLRKRMLKILRLPSSKKAEWVVSTHPFSYPKKLLCVNLYWMHKKKIIQLCIEKCTRR